jgi:hypothetical protein
MTTLLEQAVAEVRPVDEHSRTAEMLLAFKITTRSI